MLSKIWFNKHSNETICSPKIWSLFILKFSTLLIDLAVSAQMRKSFLVIAMNSTTYKYWSLLTKNMNANYKELIAYKNKL